MVPSPHIAVGHTISFPLLTIADIDDAPRCGCGARLVLSMPDDSDPTRMIGVCPLGCHPWTVVEVLRTTVT